MNPYNFSLIQSHEKSVKKVVENVKKVIDKKGQCGYTKSCADARK